MRSEEWWKGRTKFRSAPIPLLYGCSISGTTASVISTGRIRAKWYKCIEMRCAPEWRNLISTSGKGLKKRPITAHLTKP